MKNLFQVFLILISLIIVSSCETNENQSPTPLEKKAISAKWVVGGVSEYKSFEFNLSGNYVVVKNETTSIQDQTVLFGTYQILDHETVSLSDFGTIQIIGLDANSFDFSVQLTANPDSDIRISATRLKEMASSARTDLLCRTWKIESVNGQSVVGTKMELTVLFSAAGTYFVSYAVKIDENDGRLAQWKWKDKTQAELLYSWDEEPDWDDADGVEIPELASDSLVIVDDHNSVVLKPVQAVDLPL